MVNPILVLFIALALAYVFSEIFKKFFKLPRVVGHLTAGFILGIPLIKNQLFTQEVNAIFGFFANIGIILLFSFIGLGLNVKDFENHARRTGFVAIFNTSIPLLSGFLVSYYLFHLPFMVSLILGISIAVSAVAISLDILEELKLLKTKIAQMIITTGTVDDLFQFFLISIILVMFQVSIGLSSITSLIASIIAFILVLIFLRFILVPFALKQFEKEKSSTTMFMGALLIVLLIAYLAEAFKISSLIGALIAGMIVRQILLTGKNRKPWEEHDIAKSIHLISFGLLVPVFFVWVGINTSFFGLADHGLLILVLIILNIVGTLGGTILGMYVSGGSLKEGLIVGWGVLPKGDTELVIATLALAAGLISQDIFSVIVVTALVVTIISPIVFARLIRKYRRTLN